MPQRDIPNLPGKEFLIMSYLVASPRPLYGLQLVEMSDGSLKRGTIYVTLNRLEEKGYVSSRREDEQPVQAVYGSIMPGANGRHLDDLSVDQFHSRIRREEAYLRHSVELVDSDAMPAWPFFHCDAHCDFSGS